MDLQTHRNAAASRSIAKRAGLGLAVAAAAVVAIFGATSTLVGAVTTDNSTVHGNEFRKSIRIDGGAYNLAATPSTPATGGAFGPGDAEGTVTFDMQPEGADPLPLKRGESVAVEVSLPLGVSPTDVPGADTGTAFDRAWSSQQTDGIWSVRSTVTATATGPVALPGGSFGVTTQFDGIRSDEQLTVSARTITSERLTSTHPEASTVLPAAWNAQAGVYGLAMSGPSPTSVSIAFASHDGQEDEVLHLRTGESLVTSVQLPAGVHPGELPARTDAHGISTEWASAPAETGATVTATQTATEPVSTYRATTLEFPVSVDYATWVSGFTVTAGATLPERFVSAHPSDELHVAGRVTGASGHLVGAGAGHSIAVTQGDPTAFGWGKNDYGQAGTGSNRPVDTSVTPVKSAEGLRFEKISVGADHTLALTPEGEAYAWGLDAHSQTGIDMLSYSYRTPRPVRVDNNERYAQVAAGTHHSLALTADGRVKGWGWGMHGALGARVDSNTHYGRPSGIGQPANLRFVSVEAGSQSTFAIDTDGRVWAQGTNAEGRLGLGNNVSKKNTFTEVKMPGDAKIVQIVANSSTENQQTLALTDTGQVIAWGLNQGGEAGTGIDGSTPRVVWEPRLIQLPEGVRFQSLAAGDGVSLGLSTDGQVYSWGTKTLGYSSPAQTAIPTLVPLPGDAGGYVDIAAGDAHAFALDAGGTLYGWGWESGGRLGTTGNGFQVTPKPIGLPQGAAAQEAAADTGDAAGTEGTEPTDTPEAIAGEGPANDLDLDLDLDIDLGEQPADGHPGDESPAGTQHIGENTERVADAMRGTTDGAERAAGRGVKAGSVPREARARLTLPAR